MVTSHHQHGSDKRLTLSLADSPAGCKAIRSCPSPLSAQRRKGHIFTCLPTMSTGCDNCDFFGHQWINCPHPLRCRRKGCSGQCSRFHGDFHQYRGKLNLLTPQRSISTSCHQTRRAQRGLSGFASMVLQVEMAKWFRMSKKRPRFYSSLVGKAIGTLYTFSKSETGLATLNWRRL